MRVPRARPGRFPQTELPQGGSGAPRASPCPCRPPPPPRDGSQHGLGCMNGTARFAPPWDRAFVLGALSRGHPHRGARGVILAAVQGPLV